MKPYLSLRGGEFWIIDGNSGHPLGDDPLGDRCDVEVLSVCSCIVTNAHGDQIDAMEYTIKVVGRILNLFRMPGWVRRYAFGIGPWTLTVLEKTSTRHGTVHEIKPVPREAPPTTPCPECNGTRRYVGLFETTPCTTCN